MTKQKFIAYMATLKPEPERSPLFFRRLFLKRPDVIYFPAILTKEAKLYLDKVDFNRNRSCFIFNGISAVPTFGKKL